MLAQISVALTVFQVSAEGLSKVYSSRYTIKVELNSVVGIRSREGKGRKIYIGQPGHWPRTT